MRFFYVVIWFLPVLLGCAESSPVGTETPLPSGAGKIAQTPLVIILGSSTAAGYGASDYEHAWAGLLGKHLSNKTVINLAKGGYTTYHIIPANNELPAGRPRADTSRNITAALRKHPTLLIISMTTNDVASGYSVDEIMTNLKAVRQQAMAAGVRQVIVTTPHPRRISATATQMYLDQRDRILKTYGSEAVNFFDPVADATYHVRADLLSPDGIHPNNQGHAVLFEQIRKAVARIR